MRSRPGGVCPERLGELLSGPAGLLQIVGMVQHILCVLQAAAKNRTEKVHVEGVEKIAYA
jgi:hypothetical protein